jgi:hypothetical protein
MKLIRYSAALALAGLIAMPAVAQTTTPPEGTTTVGTGTGVAPATMTTTTTGAFDRLSTGNQKMATALFEAQRAGATNTSLSLDEIAAMKGSQGWGQVFKDMQSQGQLEGAKNLGQVRSGHYQPPAPSGGTGTETGAGPGTTPTSGGSGTPSTGSTATAPSASPSGSTPTSRATPVAITNGAGRTSYLGSGHGGRVNGSAATTPTTARGHGVSAGGAGPATVHASTTHGAGAGTLKTNHGSPVKGGHAR